MDVLVSKIGFRRPRLVERGRVMVANDPELLKTGAESVKT
jgi:hypothetical protein